MEMKRNGKNFWLCCSSSASTLVSLDGINIRWKRLEQNEFGRKYKTRYKETCATKTIGEEIFSDGPTFWSSAFQGHFQLDVFASLKCGSKNKHSSVGRYQVFKRIIFSFIFDKYYLTTSLKSHKYFTIIFPCYVWLAHLYPCNVSLTHLYPFIISP